MYASFPLQAEEDIDFESPDNQWYDFNIHFQANINQRWLGEKYDGIRACWNISTQILYLTFGKCAQYY